MERMERMVLAALVLTACAHGAGRFPTQAELARLADTPAPAEKVLQSKARDPERWALQAPLPDRYAEEPVAEETPWTRLVDETARARGVRVTQTTAMQCAAREIGRFFLAHQAMPSERVTRFLAVRCGSTDTHPGQAWLSGNAAAEIPEDKLAAEYQADMRELVARNLGMDPVAAGIWYGRAEGHAVAVLVTSRRRAVLEPVPMKPAGGVVEIRGEVQFPADHVVALVNRGPFGVGRCQVSSTVAMPRFAVRCEVDPADPAAWIEVAAFPPGRVLGNIVGTLLVYPGGVIDEAWTRPAHEIVDTIPKAGLAERITRLVNAARARANLAPLSIEARQSATADRLAPHYFAALAGLEPDTNADRVSLGLRAGWEVDGEVRRGLLHADIAHGDDGPAELVAASLERPSGRDVLLDPAARRIAVGTLSSGDDKRFGALIGTYSLVTEESHAEQVQAVLDRLARMRAERSLPPARPLPGVGRQLSKAVARLREGGTPDDALEGLLGDLRDRFHASTRGWWIEADALEDATIPPELLTRPSLQVAIAIGHRRPPGEPWARYVLLLVLVEPTGISAQADAARMASR